MKAKIIAWIKAYIVDRWFGGSERKAEAKVKRAEDKEKAMLVKQDIAINNRTKALHDLQKTIDEMKNEEDY